MQNTQFNALVNSVADMLIEEEAREQQEVLKEEAEEAQKLRVKNYRIEASPDVLANFERFMRDVQSAVSNGRSLTVGMAIDGGTGKFRVISPTLQKIRKNEVRRRSGSFEAV